MSELKETKGHPIKTLPAFQGTCQCPIPHSWQPTTYPNLHQINSVHSVPRVQQVGGFYLKLLHVSTSEGHGRARMWKGQWRTFKILIFTKEISPLQITLYTAALLYYKPPNNSLNYIQCKYFSSCLSSCVTMMEHTVLYLKFSSFFLVKWI